MSREFERIIERYDNAVSGLSDEVTNRIAQSIDASFRNLNRELERLYPQWEQEGSLAAIHRRLIIMEELKDLLQVIRPELQSEYETLFTETINISNRYGGRLASELIRLVEPGYPINESVTVPIEAVTAQVRDGVERLYRYNVNFKTQTSAIIEQGLIQGWGYKKVQRVLMGDGTFRSAYSVSEIKGKAEMIARTEIMSSFNRAASERYVKNGFEYQQYQVSPSEALCEYCLARNGNVYRVGDVQIPLHPRCRCIWLPWSERWERLGILDTEDMQKTNERLIKELEEKGGKLKKGPTYWERQEGLESAPTPFRTL